jgi:diguanylate cyclase (GGDEF)-like protein
VHVLLIEPSRIGQTMMKRLLEQCGHRVACASDGAVALERVRTDESIDVVLTSLELPTLSGLELCWNLRLLVGHRRSLSIMAMSSTFDDRRLAEALDCGADDFVHKPPQPAELSARLRAAERLLTAQRDLIRIATTDALTGLNNRRAFFEIAEEHVAAPDSDGALAVVLFDIDHFKAINDGHGHDAGDAVLAGMGERIRATGRIAGRLGGEEFALLLPGTSLSDAAAVAEVLRAAIAAEPFDTPAGPIAVTSSFGIALGRAGDAFDSTLKLADIALYAAKTGGRNRVIRSSQDRGASADLRVSEPA